MTNIFYVNGEFVPEDQATLPARDLAILRGYGAFDYFRTYNGKPFRLTKNLARLRRTCELLELDLIWSDEELCSIIYETLERNAGTADEHGVRLVITGGISSNNTFPDGQPSLMVMVQPMVEMASHYYTDGAKVITVPNKRLIPEAKSILYTPAILAQKQAKAANAIEALYTTDEGYILEATTSNVFAFFGDTLVTPPSNGELLPGITRMTVLELAEQRFTVEERPLTLSELLTADEVFISSANREVLPIIQVDDTVIGTGKPGQQTKTMIALFWDFAMRFAGQS